jgi:hypothetical protein
VPLNAGEITTGCGSRERIGTAVSSRTAAVDGQLSLGRCLTANSPPQIDSAQKPSEQSL